MQLNGIIALLTGSDSGIGQASAEVFAESGADLAITFHSGPGGARLTEQRVKAQGRALVLQLDVTDADAVQKALHQVVAHFGGLALIVNNAGKGMGTPTRVDNLSEDQLDLTLATNLKGPLHCGM